MFSKRFSACIPVAIGSFPIGEVREPLGGSRMEEDAAIIRPKADVCRICRRWFFICCVIFELACFQAVMILALGDWVLAVFNHPSMPGNWKKMVV